MKCYGHRIPIKYCFGTKFYCVYTAFLCFISTGLVTTFKLCKKFIDNINKSLTRPCTMQEAMEMTSNCVYKLLAKISDNGQG